MRLPNGLRFVLLLLMIMILIRRGGIMSKIKIRSRD
jgi:hypothetical protein